MNKNRDNNLVLFIFPRLFLNQRAILLARLIASLHLIFFFLHYTNTLSLASSATLEISPNFLKPHHAIDVSLQIPENFNRYSNNSFISFKDINSPSRYVLTTTKDIIPGKRYGITLGGFSPATTYAIKVILNSDGVCLFNGIITFTTQSAPKDEVETLLMVIDDDLNTFELEREFNRYIDSIVEQEGNIRVEKYYIGKSYQEKINLYTFIREEYLKNNLSTLFFIGKNSSFPVKIILLDEYGDEARIYNYEGLSFYSHYWITPYEFRSEENDYVIVYGLNNSATPDLYTSFVNNSAMADISFGAFIPTSGDSYERERQTIDYFRKLWNYRYGEIAFKRRVLYSDTMWGNSYVEQDLARLAMYKNNTPISTSHNPDFEYHLQDSSWKEEYLYNIENQSYEIAWINVHGSPTYHYFGISNTNIKSLSALNVAFISLQSCSTGNYMTPGYLAGTYIATGHVLAVEANMYPTFYIQKATTEFSPHHTLYEVAHGKKSGDALRQHGSMHIGHVLFGDPMLTFGTESLRSPKTTNNFWALVLPTILSNAKRTAASRNR